MNEKTIYETIKDLAGKKTAFEIACICDVSTSTIRKYASRLGVSLELSKNLERRKLIDSLLEKGDLTAQEIAKKLEIPIETVYYRSWKLGFPLKPTQNKVRGLVRSCMKEGEFFNERKMENWLIG